MISAFFVFDSKINLEGTIQEFCLYSRIATEKDIILISI